MAHRYLSLQVGHGVRGRPRDAAAMPGGSGRPAGKVDSPDRTRGVARGRRIRLRTSGPPRRCARPTVDTRGERQSGHRA